MGSLVDYQYELRLSLYDTSAFPGIKYGKSSAIALHLLDNSSENRVLNLQIHKSRLFSSQVPRNTKSKSRIKRITTYIQEGTLGKIHCHNVSPYDECRHPSFQLSQT